jgi:hypothetical protein
MSGGLLLLTGDQSPGASAQLTPGSVTNADGFPEQILGVPVVPVGVAESLIRDGWANGRAIAVGGWWLPGFGLGCPYPGRMTLTIEGYCSNDYIASAPFERITCTNLGQGRSECHGNPVPQGVSVIPGLAVEETSGADRLGNEGPVVLILHGADPRSLQCPQSQIDECRTHAVVDRVAWAAGAPVALNSQLQAPAELTVEEAIAASGVEGEAVTAASIASSDGWTIDPRIHGVGDDLIWIIRGLTDDVRAPEDPTRGLETRVVADATAELSLTLPLELDPGHEPARLVVQAAWPDMNAGFDSAFSVATLGGDLVALGAMGSAGIPNVNDTILNSASVPVVLDAGSYEVRVWLGAETAPEDVKALHGCAFVVDLDAASRLTLQAALKKAGPCEFVPPTFRNGFDQ